MVTHNIKTMDDGFHCFVSGALSTILRVLRFAGIAPLRFVKKNTGWRVSLSTGWSTYGYIIVTIFNLITIGTVICELQLDQEKAVRMRNRARKVVWIVDSSLVMLIAGVAVYGAPGQMKSMITCFNQVEKLNYDLNTHCCPVLSEKQKIRSFILWAMFTVVLFCIDNAQLMYTINLINANYWICLMYSFYYCCYWIVQVRAMLFIIITLHVMSTFKALNNSLKTLLDDGIPKPAYSQHKTIRRLTLVYTSACNVVRMVNQSHGLIALMMLGFYLLRIVVTVYYFINNLIEKDTSASMTLRVIFVMVQLFWCLFHILNLVMAIEPCHLTHMEMETTRELVGELMLRKHDTYEPLEMELERFFRHLILNQASYSPLQVTTISRSLLATIFASITTYLSVIVQL